MDHKLYMQRALQLAQLGLGSVSPNPMVGCVIVHEGIIIGEGYHKQYGGPHAEVNAINSVKDQALLSNATAYVTLEPCAHHGKTPPCADLLIEKNIKKVVIACRDPFIEVDGKGIEKLRNANVEVEVGILDQDGKDLNRRFFVFHEEKRPYVILKWAQTSDGFIARENYDSKWISNKNSRQLVHTWRAEEHAILVGKRTAIHDDPELTVRDWHGANPIRILLDSNLEVPLSNKVFNSSARTLIINAMKSDEKKNLKWIQSNNMTPNTLLQLLYHENIQSVIVEGGSSVLNSFIKENCWDEARVFTSQSKFETGIPAPQIKGSVVENKTIQEDELIIYRNFNG